MTLEDIIKEREGVLKDLDKEMNKMKELKEYYEYRKDKIRSRISWLNRYIGMLNGEIKMKRGE